MKVCEHCGELVKKVKLQYTSWDYYPKSFMEQITESRDESRYLFWKCTECSEKNIVKREFDT